MKRRRFGVLKVTAFVSVVIGILLIGELTQAMAESWLAAEENQMVQQVNDHRASMGRPALKENAGVKMIARRQAQRMVLAKKIYHNPDLMDEADQAIPDWLLLGENVGVGPTEPEVEAAFLNSPEHRSNIEDADYNIIGIGAMANDDGRMFFTQDFAQVGRTSSKSTATTAKKKKKKKTTKPAPAPSPKRKKHVAPLIQVQGKRVTSHPVSTPTVAPSPTPSPSPTPTPVVSRTPVAVSTPSSAPAPKRAPGEGVNLFNGLAAMLGEAIRKIGHALSKLAFWR
jgi:hypothetical protein